MGCFLGCLLAIWPRFALLIVWVFGLARGYGPAWYWCIPGFIFAPATTFAYQLCMYHGQLKSLQESPTAMVIVGLGVLHDLGQLLMLKPEKDE